MSSFPIWVISGMRCIQPSGQKLLHLMIDKVTVYCESLEIEVKTRRNPINI